MGRFCKETKCVRMTVEPEKMPADPVPATALPRIKATEFGAAPQIVDPISKTMMERRKTVFVE
jgi:hypothetical protein